MPNWIEGNIKIRGKQDDVIKFLENELGEGDEKCVSVWRNEDEAEIEVTKDWSWIKGSRRAFVGCGCTYLGKYNQTACLPVYQAWNFQPENFIDFTKKYNVDIRLQGVEQGMQFTEDVIIQDGEVVYHDVNQYDDWYWECPTPYMGG